MSATIRRAILYSVLGLALCAFCWVQGAAHATDLLVEQSAYQLLAGHTTALRVQDSLRGVSQRAKADADSLRAHPRYVQIVTAHHDTVQTVDTIWVNQQVADLNRAYSACSEALTLCRARSDSLEKSLHDLLRVRECRLIGFLPCPPRGALLIAGGVLGFLLGHR